jgi:hypothetical protein
MRFWTLHHVERPGCRVGDEGEPGNQWFAVSSRLPAARAGGGSLLLDAYWATTVAWLPCANSGGLAEAAE